MIKGKEPKDFSKEDWKDIAYAAIEYGITIDGDEYSLFVFDLYAKYLALSVEINKERIDDECSQEVYALVDELNTLGEQFKNDSITEPVYVDKCLWICLEALVKLMAAYRTKFIPSEYASLIRALSDYAVSFARYKMYQQERALIEEYIQNQYVLDEELTQKYKIFYANLQDEANKFNSLIDKAFDKDFKTMLRSFVDLALATGVQKEEVLDSIEKIDDFFM